MSSVFTTEHCNGNSASQRTSQTDNMMLTTCELMLRNARTDLYRLYSNRREHEIIAAHNRSTDNSVGHLLLLMTATPCNFVFYGATMYNELHKCGLLSY